jgi:phosphomannomutase
MKRRLIAFDLDGTIAVSKSAISDVMALALRELLGLYNVSIISGGSFVQFQEQILNHLEVPHDQLMRLHLLPTSGTKYFRFISAQNSWELQYSEDLPLEQRQNIINVLTTGAKNLRLWEASPFGEVIEDRGSQVTFSALGQAAPPDAKYAWDPSGQKKEALRAYVAPKLPDLEVRTGGTTSIDVTNKGIDKAYGMRKLMATLELTVRDILYFGDQLEPGGNDYAVKAMGIDTITVTGWEQTAVSIEAIVKVSP